MSSAITLSAATRQNLLSLQDTAGLAATNQGRLATGKKVNSALDNPVNFFTAQNLSNRSTALSGLLDGISNGIQTIQAAAKGIDTVTSLVKQLQSVVSQAQSNAATNLPKVSGTVALGTSGEASTTGKSQRDVAMAKTVLGTAAPATSSAGGNLGLSASAANQVQLKAGNAVYTYTVAATDTLGDVVNAINKSGLANASVDSNGLLSVTGSGSDALTVSVGATAAGTFTASTADTALLFGTATTSGVTGGGTSAQRSALVDQFKNLRTQINQAAQDAGFNGTNLLAGDKLTVVFNEKTGGAQSKLDVQGDAVTASGLGIGSLIDSATTQPGADFGVQNNADLTKASNALTNALTSLNSLSSTLGSNLSVVQTRQDFTKNLVNVLETGSANLTNADMNEEAANSQALSTRQSLGISALSLANQANQGILQLLR
ncbi:MULTISPECIES: flagellin [Methylorubrum]|uniref:flagellin N-terminal helical domain-containing protein n=1 Tax=Methylorubrum TaxID=2282523 RepID=UPI0020A0B053|nr:flagellin [Methylorubrum extorquens]MDH6637497.1 flagellin [Methylobacterium sp. SuP10 SLI 274]MDH6666676.1 flagellin [Methylorubrum zatmanii]MCP1538189.1 flagellin-like hook-associated protein FlgL [Methylorubrum extorquens]MCP1558586.1 flagellin-like hook-associated protein FlgL [Methylorubrum extorquens]MDF9792215.1 flagellin [Methylorubrum extorquens]